MERQTGWFRTIAEDGREFVVLEYTRYENGEPAGKRYATSGGLEARAIAGGFDLVESGLLLRLVPTP